MRAVMSRRPLPSFLLLGVSCRHATTKTYLVLKQYSGLIEDDACLTKVNLKQQNSGNNASSEMEKLTFEYKTNGMMRCGLKARIWSIFNKVEDVVENRCLFKVTNTEVVASWQSVHTCGTEDEDQRAAEIAEFFSSAGCSQILGGIDFCQ